MNGDMAVSAAGSALNNAALQADYQVAAAKKSLDAQRLEGDAVLKLIQSASVEPGVGRNLNVSA